MPKRGPQSVNKRSALGQKRTLAVHYKVSIKNTFSAGSVFQKYRFSGGGPALLEHLLEKETPMSRATKAATIALSIAFAGITVVDAMAGNWGQNHPRREQVNDRLQNQNRRINREVREGEITKGEARQLHSEDRAIRSERADNVEAQQRSYNARGAKIAQSAGKRG
jgi:hypothetical protein